MQLSIALILLFAVGWVHAGQPLHNVLKLRTIEVLRCEAVTRHNVAELSRFLRDASSDSGVEPDPREALDDVPGFLVEGIVRRQRDLAFPLLGDSDPITDTQWTGTDTSTVLAFFVPGDDPDTCEGFVHGDRVNAVLSPKGECDTYPPVGICVFDQPIRLVEPATWANYGE